MPENSTFLSERLRKDGDKTIQFFEGLNSEQWQTIIYTEGETWNMRSILSHFVSAETGFIGIFNSIRDGGPGVSEDFNIDRYNASQQKKNKELLPADLIKQFKGVRTQMIDFVASLSDDDLAKQGRHPFLGQTSLSEMIKMVYRHNQIHVRDFRKVTDKG